MATTKKLAKDDVLKQLAKLAKSTDPEDAHIEADNLLLQFIDDVKIAAAYGRITRWYS